jgi:UDP-N-acetylglucosamine 4,6-dehydratase/5-epimerase
MNFKGKTILITGGTGSFGNAFLNYIIVKENFKEVRIFSRDEKKQDDMRKNINNRKVKFYLGDVYDIDSLEAPLSNVDYVFHAAAYKQVPSCEFYPFQALKNNVIGTKNVIEKAIEKKVKKIVCLSTDKAVYPINAMGISKAMMEKIVISKSLLHENSTSICITRYGNVLASRGSVVPLFINQIKNNQNITITDPEMTRFIMPMSEAINLVLFALKNGKNGEIFIPKTPAAKIKDIAKSVYKFLRVDKIKIKNIGVRHGEKQHETLMTKEESIKAISFGKYYKIPSDLRDLNYEKYFSKGTNKNKKAAEYSSNNVKLLKVDEIVKILSKIKSELNYI